MAKVKELSGAFEGRIGDALRKGLRIAGIQPARISVGPIQGTKLHRVIVEAPAFKKLRPTERQDLVWRIIGQKFPPDDHLRISMILTVTPAEFRGQR